MSLPNHLPFLDSLQFRLTHGKAVSFPLEDRFGSSVTVVRDGSSVPGCWYCDQAGFNVALSAEGL